MRKILKKISNRLVIFGLLLLVQLGWFLVFLTRLASYSTGVSVLFTLVSLVAVLWILNRDENPAYKNMGGN